MQKCEKTKEYQRQDDPAEFTAGLCWSSMLAERHLRAQTRHSNRARNMSDKTGEGRNENTFVLLVLDLGLYSVLSV